MDRKPRVPTSVAVLFGVILAAGCNTVPGNQAQLRLEYSRPSDIIVGGLVTGRFENVAGCVRFSNSNWQKAAIFPDGSKLSMDSRTITLPNGEGSIRLGSNVTVSYEAPPSLTRDKYRCPLEPILILSARKP